MVYQFLNGYLDTAKLFLYNTSVNLTREMTLTSKFKKDLSTLRAAVNKEIYLDVKNPKLYKKFKRYYQNEVEFTGEDPEYDYNLVVECLAEDLTEVA